MPNTKRRNAAKKCWSESFGYYGATIRAAERTPGGVRDPIRHRQPLGRGSTDVARVEAGEDQEGRSPRLSRDKPLVDRRTTAVVGPTVVPLACEARAGRVRFDPDDDDD